VHGERPDEADREAAADAVAEAEALALRGGELRADGALQVEREALEKLRVSGAREGDERERADEG